MAFCKDCLKKNYLLISTIAGVILGLVLGFSLKHENLGETWIQLIGYPGEIFTRSLELMILPLIITSLTVGSASINAKANGRIAVRTLSYFLLTSLFNAILGVIIVQLVHPGNPYSQIRNDVATEFRERKNTLLDNFLDLGRNVIPSNIFTALFQNTQTIYVESTSDVGITYSGRIIGMKDGPNTLGIITFSIVFGMVLGSMGEAKRGVTEGLAVIDNVIIKITQGLMWVTPFGVGSIIATRILSVDDIENVGRQLGLFILTVLGGILIYQLIFLQLIYLVVLQRNPFRFYVSMAPAMIVAFATSSTAMALPVTFSCMEKAGVDHRISQFILPVGATINKDGTALFVSVASVFIAQMNGVSLGITEYVTVIITSTAVSIASAAIPSAALALMFIVLNGIGLPTTDVGLLFAVDWLVDRIRTTNNHLGDCYATAVIEHFSKHDLNINVGIQHGSIPSNKHSNEEDTVL